MERAVWYSKNHFTQKYYFTVRFTKLLTNGFQSSLRTWQFHYVFVNQIVNFERSCEFHAEFRWEVAKLAPFSASWFDNITTQMNLNKVKKKSSTKQCLFYDV